MDDGLKTAFYLLAPIAVASLFVPVIDNPNPRDCNNYPDGAGGYYLKCKDEYISLFTKYVTLDENNSSTKSGQNELSNENTQPTESTTSVGDSTNTESTQSN